MKITQMSKGEKLNSNTRNQHLRLLLLEYTQGIIDMASNVTSNNINQIISLIKANVKVLENDVQQSFTKRDDEDFHYREMN